MESSAIKSLKEQIFTFKAELMTEFEAELRRSQSGFFRY